MSQERTDTLVVIAATGPDELLVDAVAALGGDALRIQIHFFAGFADVHGVRQIDSPCRGGILAPIGGSYSDQVFLIGITA